MNFVPQKRRIYFLLSFSLLIVGIFSWFPYLIFNIQVPFGMLTTIINSIGMYLGYLSNNRLLALSNLIMVFSIIPVIGYIYLTKGYLPM